MKPIKYLLASLCLAGLVSCDKDDNNGVEDYSHLTPVEFTHQVIDMETGTSTGSVLDSGCEAGVYMLKHGTNIVLRNTRNQKYIAEENGTLLPSGDDGIARYSDDPAEYSDFMAYSPYKENVENFLYPANITEQGTPAAIDLLYSNNAVEVTNEESAAVVLEFAHQMSKIYMNLKAGQGLTESDLRNIDIKVNGLPTRANFNLALGRFVDLSTEQTITALTTVEGDASQVIVYPMYDALFDLDITLANKSTFVWESDEPVTLQTGKIHVYNVTVGSSSVEVSQGDILDWDGIDDLPTIGTGEGSGTSSAVIYKVGDTYPKDETPIGIVYEITDGGRHGKVVSLIEKQHRWGAYPQDESITGVPSIRDEENGKAGTVELISVRSEQGNFAGDYAIFHWLFTELNNSDLEGEWYAPAKNELKALLIAMSGLDYESIANSWNDGDMMPQINETKEARNEFNQKIEAAGGTPFADASYWTSTEYNDSKVWFINWGTGLLSSDRDKYDEWAPRLRGILEF